MIGLSYAAMTVLRQVLLRSKSVCSAASLEQGNDNDGGGGVGSLNSLAHAAEVVFLSYCSEYGPNQFSGNSPPG